MLGPGAIIASLSLGATRTFRVRCLAQQQDSQGRGLPSQPASADTGPPSKRAGQVPQEEAAPKTGVHCAHIQLTQCDRLCQLFYWE